jgi:hypothetical protein
MNEPQKCECRDDACWPDGRSLDRRTFVKLTALTAASASATGMPVMAGPFDDVNEYLRAIPSDKKLR